MQPIPWRVPLSVKLAGVMATLIAGMAIFLLIYFPGQMGAMSRNWAELRARDLLTVIADAVSAGVTFNDQKGVDDVFRALEAAPDVLYAEVHRTDDSRLTTWGSESEPEGLQLDAADGPALRIADGRLHSVIKIKSQGEPVGTLHMGFSLAALEQAKKENRRSVGLAVFVISVVGLLFSFVIGNVFVRPIRSLTQATKRIVKEGDLTQTITVTSGDEVGELATSFQQMVNKLRTIPTTLHNSVADLGHTVGNISHLSDSMTASVHRQASNLSQVSTSTQEIKKTSEAAAEMVKTVLEVVKKAEEYSVSGQDALETSITSLKDIRAQVDTIVARISNLSERTSQVGEITESVKRIADKSSLLALNAAIEAAKAGEAGKTFGVVAGEIRALADQSIQSTAHIHEILSEIQDEIRDTVKITEEGSRRVEQSIQQSLASGESLRKMTAVTQENSQVARKIAASVREQGIGIDHISAALVILNTHMEDTVGEIQRADEAVRDLKSTSDRISEIVKAYRA